MSELRDLLVIEDEAVVRRATRRILADQELQVEFARDARQALEQLRRNRFRLILCDLMLPGSSGLDLIPSVQEINPPAQFVVVTGYATLEHALDSFAAGAFDFLPKPFDAGELEGVVARGLAFYDLQASERSGGQGPDRLRHRAGSIETYRMGRHAWAAVEPDGSATLGAAETFSPLLPRSAIIHLPTAGDQVQQGGTLVRVACASGAMHRIWSPLSGRVITVNDRLSTEPSLLITEPFEAGWLAKIVPESLAEASRLEKVRGPVSRMSRGGTSW